MLANCDEGAGLLQAPATAAKEEQLERHKNSKAHQSERNRGCAVPSQDSLAGPTADGPRYRKMTGAARVGRG
jgi:hypothetical protein